MQGSNMQNARMDGMGIVVTGANSLEMLQQIEVLNGVGGAIYGPANPSGMFNFVPKRPTDAPVSSGDVRLRQSAVGTIRADVGGRVGGDQAVWLSRERAVRRRTGLREEQRSQAWPRQLRRRRPAVREHDRSRGSTATTTSCSRDSPAGSPTGGRTPGARSSSCRRMHRIRRVRASDRRLPAWTCTSSIGELRVKHDINSTLASDAPASLISAPTGTSARRSTRSRAAPGNYTSSLAIGFAPQFRVLSDLAVAERPIPDRTRHPRRRHWKRRLHLQLVLGRHEPERRQRLARHRPASPLRSSSGCRRPVYRRTTASSCRARVHQQGINVSDTVDARTAMVGQARGQSGLDLDRQLQQPERPNQRLPDERRQPAGEPDLQTRAAT